MNVRETLAENRGRATAIAGGALLLGIVVLVAFQLRGLNNSSPGASPSQAFFTIDDGKTWFPDDSAKIPPFNKDGKPAVLAHVYRCGDGTKFVNHLERFTPEAKRALEAAQKPADPNTRPPPGQSGAIQSAYVGGREVKRPGDTKWINAANFRDAAAITAIKCPSGGTNATPVDP
jgi:hypothetical protein